MRTYFTLSIYYIKETIYIRTKGDFNMKNNCDCYSIVSGNSLDLDVNFCESEIRADVVVSEYNSVRLWGRIINCDGEPVANALIKLLKVNCKKDHISYTGVAHTVSDCDGFYQFELCASNEEHHPHHKPCYKILVSKAAMGPERTIPTSSGNCNVCDPKDCDCDCDCDRDRCDTCFECDPVIIPPEEQVFGNPYYKNDHSQYQQNYPKQNPRY